MRCLQTLAQVAILVSLMSSFLVAQQNSEPSRATPSPPKTVRVFVLAGQSNMQGHGVVDPDQANVDNGGQGTLVYFLNNAENRQRFPHLGTGDDPASRNDVLISCQTRHGIKRGKLTTGYTGHADQNHFGPELQFGHVTGDYFEEPVLLVKTAWGGKSLHRDFRPPAAVAARGGETGEYYTQMLQQVSEAIATASEVFPDLKTPATFEISGFVWQQGWNDMIDEAARQEYHENLVDLIHDVRKHWNRPALPVVVGELGNGGSKMSAAMKHFRQQQSRIAAHPPFVGNVAFVPTAQHARPADASPHPGHLHHWSGNAESYLLVGDSLGRQMVDLLSTPRRPRVLILGDSISIGYTPLVQQALAETAWVVRPMNNHRAAENCAGTLKGVKELDRWLSIGGGQWDVIHFNFGLHDLKHVDATTGKNSNNPDDPQQSSPEQYAKHLRQIVKRLGKTGAKLIFATTTPVPDGGVRPYRAVSAPQQYNQIAREIMRENGVAVNDLYEFASQRLEAIQQPVNVHFTKEGSQQLAGEVVRHIRQALDDSE